jgi:hypothetical protein
LVGWFGDRGPRSDFLIATMDLDKPSGFQVWVIRLLETLNQEFREFSSTLGGQSQCPCGQLLNLAHMGSSSPIVDSSQGYTIA